MYVVEFNQNPRVAERLNPLLDLPMTGEAHPDRALDGLLADLSPDTPWGERQIAARKLGAMRCSEALPWLLTALPEDPFWMVRCAIIQALEMLDDPQAIPILREVAANDRFQVVRSYASKAIERLQ
jgi:HEAT repeat protein